MRLVAATILFILLSGCSIRQVECTGIKGFTVQNISTQGVSGSLLLSLKNPNSFGFTILKSRFDVFYSGIRLGQATLDKRVRIKGNAEETYSFRLTGDFRNTNLVDVLKLVNGGTRRNLMDVKGKLRVMKFPLYRSFPVEISEPVRLE